MIPILGDGSGIIKELYNKHTTGEMDELNFTLGVIGLAMDLPFDGGILGDTAVATLKAACTMIPSGAAREILLEALQQVGKNPEQLIALAGAFGKMAGKDDLMKIITSNPEVFKAYLNGGAEAAENLLKYEDEIIQAGKSLSGDELIALMDGGKAALHSADEVVEAGAKVVVSSGDEVVEAGAKVVVNSSDEVVESGGRLAINSGNEPGGSGGRLAANSGDEAVGSGGSVLANSGGEAAESGGKVIANASDEVLKSADEINEGFILLKDGEQFSKDGRMTVLKSDVTYITEGGYTYKTDNYGRISTVEGSLSLGDASRNPYAQTVAGRADRLPTDDGGHLIATRYLGSGNLDNLLPMDANLNRGAWKAMENEWAEALLNDEGVFVKIKAIYEGTSQRPTMFEVRYIIDGEEYFRPFANIPGGK